MIPFHLGVEGDMFISLLVRFLVLLLLIHVTKLVNLECYLLNITPDLSQIIATFHAKTSIV